MINKKYEKILIYLLIFFSFYSAVIVGRSWDEGYHLLLGKITLEYLFSLGIQPLHMGLHHIEGRDIFLAHGDEPDRSLGYRLMRGVLRSSVFAYIMSSLGPKRGYWLLEQLKSGSAVVRLGGELLLQHQKEWVLENQYPRVVMGHSHYLGAFSLDGRELILLGDWPNKKSYFILNEEGGSLYSFDEPVKIGLFR